MVDWIDEGQMQGNHVFAAKNGWFLFGRFCKPKLCNFCSGAGGIVFKVRR